MKQISGVREVRYGRLHVGSLEALQELLTDLDARGYLVTPDDIEKSAKGSGVWTARPPERSVQRIQRCSSCGFDDMIDAVPKPFCGSCGERSLRFGEAAGVIRGLDLCFRFNDAAAEDVALRMRLYEIDRRVGMLLFTPRPVLGDEFDVDAETARRTLFRHNPYWFSVHRDGKDLIGIPYRHESRDNCIEILDGPCLRRNYVLIRRYDGRDYGEFDHIRLLRHYLIFECWLSAQNVLTPMEPLVGPAITDDEVEQAFAAAGVDGGELIIELTPDQICA